MELGFPSNSQVAEALTERHFSRPKSRRSENPASRISRGIATSSSPEQLDLQSLSLKDDVEQPQPGPSTPPSRSQVIPEEEEEEEEYQDPFEQAPLLHSEAGECYLFDVDVETFVVQDASVIAEIRSGGVFDYWLVIRDHKKIAFISVPLDSEMVPRLHEAERAFMFSFNSAESGTSSTWCVKFAEQEQFVSWKAAFTQYMWEGRNKMSWAKAKADEQRYIGSQYEDVEMEDVEGREAGDSEEEEVEDESDVGTSSYDEDESESDSETFNRAAKGKNEKLTVGYKNDRSFVVRGDMIGVFKHTDDNKVKWQTSINRVSDLKGKAFTPKKVSLAVEVA